MNNWLGPFKTADDALDNLRRTVAEIIGTDPHTWPNHKNAPLAIAAAIGLREGEIKQLTKERDALRALVVMRFDHDYPPQFTQGHDLHELTEPVTAEHCRWFVAEIERLRTACDALRAKVEAMERQEPVGVLHVGSYYGEELQDWEFEANQRACDKLNEEYVGSPTSLPLYALPGAKGE